MLPSPITPNPLALAYLDALTQDVLGEKRAVTKARAYYDGEHLTFLDDRLRAFLNADGADETFRLNVYRIVVEAVIERLMVEHFDCADAEVKAWADSVWTGNQMPIRADDTHEMAVRDGQAFVIVDFDDAANRARFTPHPLYVPTEAGGDAFGCEMVYPDGDPSQPPEYGVKRWTEPDEKNIPQQRATFYYPERIEKYIYRQGWQPLQEEGDATWPLPWVGADKKPLGIAVVHFKNRGLRPEGTDAVGVQDGLNKTYIDLLATADVTAFRIFSAFGWIPTTDGKAPAADGSNALTIKPGSTIGSNRSAQEANFNAIDPADLTQLRELVSDQVKLMAVVTNTPASRFQISGQHAAEGTLQEQQEPLLAKVRSRQKLFGAAWENCLDVARRVANTFGAAGLNEDAAITTVWAEARSRSDADRQNELKFWKEMGIPRRELWSAMGFSQEKIEEMLKDPEVMNQTFTNFP